MIRGVRIFLDRRETQAIPDQVVGAVPTHNSFQALLVRRAKKEEAGHHDQNKLSPRLKTFKWVWVPKRVQPAHREAQDCYHFNPTKEKEENERGLALREKEIITGLPPHTSFKACAQHVDVRTLGRRFYQLVERARLSYIHTTRGKQPSSVLQWERGKEEMIVMVRNYFRVLGTSLGQQRLL